MYFAHEFSSESHQSWIETVTAYAVFSKKKTTHCLFRGGNKGNKLQEKYT
jgi:hypothetical protein